MTEQAENTAILSPSGNALLPIREVVRLTGVNPVTLRAWERRYGLLQPVRTEGGHRLYSMADVNAVREIVSWTERGVAVSKVGALLKRNHPLQDDASKLPSDAPDSPDWRPWQDEIRSAVAGFDENRLEQLYGQVFSLYPLAQAFCQVFVPVWRELLARRDFGRLSQWLFYDAFLRTRVSQRLQATRRQAEGCVLVAALADHCKELDLLVTGLLLGDEGMGVHVSPIGQPLDELPLLCQCVQPETLVLLAPVPPSSAQLAQVNRLALAVGCPVALAGEGAERVADQLHGSPIAMLGSEPGIMRVRLRQFRAGRLDT